MTPRPSRTQRLLQRPFEAVAVVQVVVRLQRLRSAAARCALVVRAPGPAARRVRLDAPIAFTLPCCDQPRVGLERLVERRRLVVPVRLVEVDGVDLQPPQRLLDAPA